LRVHQFPLLICHEGLIIHIGITANEKKENKRQDRKGSHRRGLAQGSSQRPSFYKDYRDTSHLKTVTYEQLLRMFKYRFKRSRRSLYEISSAPYAFSFDFL